MPPLPADDLIRQAPAATKPPRTDPRLRLVARAIWNCALSPPDNVWSLSVSSTTWPRSQMPPRTLCHNQLPSSVGGRRRLSVRLVLIGPTALTPSRSNGEIRISVTLSRYSLVRYPAESPACRPLECQVAAPSDTGASISGPLLCPPSAFRPLINGRPSRYLTMCATLVHSNSWGSCKLGRKNNRHACLWRRSGWIPPQPAGLQSPECSARVKVGGGLSVGAAPASGLSANRVIGSETDRRAMAQCARNGAGLILDWRSFPFFCSAK